MNHSKGVSEWVYAPVSPEVVLFVCIAGLNLADMKLMLIGDLWVSPFWRWETTHLTYRVVEGFDEIVSHAPTPLSVATTLHKR